MLSRSLHKVQLAEHLAGKAASARAGLQALAARGLTAEQLRRLLCTTLKSKPRCGPRRHDVHRQGVLRHVTAVTATQLAIWQVPPV